MTDFNKAKAIEEYSGLMRIVRVGAYQERDAELYKTDTWPEDGVEESIHNLEEIAAQSGLEFLWHEESGTYTLEPMRDETKFARRASVDLSGGADATLTSDGHLIVHNKEWIVTISATQAWNLLSWLTDYHRDRLYQISQQEASTTNK